DSAADREGNEDLVAGRGDEVDHALAGFRAGRDVVEDQLVDQFGVVPPGQLERVTDVDVAEEVDALGHPAVVYVQARNDPDRDRHPDSTPPDACPDTTPRPRDPGPPSGPPYHGRHG